MQLSEEKRKFDGDSPNPATVSVCAPENKPSRQLLFEGETEVVDPNINSHSLIEDNDSLRLKKAIYSTDIFYLVLTPDAKRDGISLTVSVYLCIRL